MRALVRGGFVSVGSRATRALLGFASSVLLARGLGPFGFGLFTTGLLVARVVSLAAPLGMSGAISRFSAGGGEAERRLARSATSIGSTSSLFIGGLVLALAEPMATIGFGQPELGAVLRVGGITAATLGVVRVLASLSRFDFAAAPAAIGQEIVPSVFAVGAGVLALVAGIDAVTALIVLTAGSVVGATYLLRVVGKPYGSFALPQVDTTQRLLRFGVPAAASASLSFLVYRVDRLLLAGLAAPDVVGVYAVASQIALVPAMALSAVNSVLSPLLGATHRDRASREKASLYGFARVSTILMTSPLFILILGAPFAVLTILFGDSYSGGGWILLILGCGQFINMSVGSVGTVHMMSGAERRWVGLVVVANVIVVLGSVALVPRLGAVGAATASATGIAVLNTVGFLLQHRTEPLPRLTPRWRLGLASIPAVAASLLLLGDSMGAGDWRFWLIAVGAAALAPVALWSLVASDAERATIKSAVRSRGQSGIA